MGLLCAAVTLDSPSHTHPTLSPVVPYSYLVLDILMQETTCVKLAMEHVLMKWTAVESHQSLEPFASTSQVSYIMCVCVASTLQSC